MVDHKMQNAPRESVVVTAYLQLQYYTITFFFFSFKNGLWCGVHRPYSVGCTKPYSTSCNELCMFTTLLRSLFAFFLFQKAHKNLFHCAETETFQSQSTSASLSVYESGRKSFCCLPVTQTGSLADRLLTYTHWGRDTDQSSPGSQSIVRHLGHQFPAWPWPAAWWTRGELSVWVFTPWKKNKTLHCAASLHNKCFWLHSCSLC